MGLLAACMVLFLAQDRPAWGEQKMSAQGPARHATGNEGHSAGPNHPSGHGAPGSQTPTLKDTQRTVAQIRKSKGKMQYTTNDDRWAAAQRHADRQARALAEGKGGGK